MMQTKLLIKAEKQEYGKSCWASCSRMVYNFYAKSNVYSDDKKLATAVKLDVSSFHNIQEALETLKMYDGQDDKANIPTMKEIKESIYNNGEALIVCLSTTKVAYGKSVSKGHYVVIAGFDDRNNKLYILDPNSGIPEWIKYDKNICKFTAYQMYWGITYYTTKSNIKE